MADFDNLTSRGDWQSALDNLLAMAAQANDAATRDSYRRDLRSFRNACPFGDIRDRALEALNNLSLADIDQALSHLHNVRQRLLDDQHHLQSTSAASAEDPILMTRRE